ncbi:aldo/keto reductase family protein [Candidatus Erwinia dacicola]|uniref:Aldo/keto reductase family protein n=1 Tax=Candidatus Erwinia dacicola TaxID=252393 RepID=A0A328TS37_9GAMM|nr:aldo/keto reductase family protein [Candidatus Erwinia dacicola]
MSNLSGGLSRANILQSIDDSLEHLGMDHVDLLQIHCWDYNTPLEETLEALHDMVQSGKRAISVPLPCIPSSLPARYIQRITTARRGLSACRISTT